MVFLQGAIDSLFVTLGKDTYIRIPVMGSWVGGQRIAKIGKTISIYTPLTTDVFHVSLVPQCQSTTHLNKPEVLLPLCQFRVYNERAFSMGREEKPKRWGGGAR